MSGIYDISDPLLDAGSLEKSIRSKNVLLAVIATVSPCRLLVLVSVRTTRHGSDKEQQCSVCPKPRSMDLDPSISMETLSHGVPLWHGGLEARRRRVK